MHRTGVGRSLHSKLHEIEVLKRKKGLSLHSIMVLRYREAQKKIHVASVVMLEVHLLMNNPIIGWFGLPNTLMANIQV